MISKITPDNVVNESTSKVSLVLKNIPFLGGRPQRDTIISSDDITNLIIACNTCSCLEDFYKVT
jgi:hypothetical protein